MAAKKRYPGKKGKLIHLTLEADKRINVEAAQSGMKTKPYIENILENGEYNRKK